MEDHKIKRMLAEALRHKEVIKAFLDDQNPEDMERGNLYITERLLNQTARGLLTEIGEPYLEKYQIGFREGKILIFATAFIKQFGRIDLEYDIQIIEFQCKHGIRKLTASYREKAECRGNALQTVAFNAMGLSRHLLKTAAGFLKTDFLRVNEDLLSVDLSKTDLAEKIPENLMLQYKGSDQGSLKLYFEMSSP